MLIFAKRRKNRYHNWHQNRYQWNTNWWIIPNNLLCNIYRCFSLDFQFLQLKHIVMFDDMFDIYAVLWSHRFTCRMRLINCCATMYIYIYHIKNLLSITVTLCHVLHPIRDAYGFIAICYFSSCVDSGVHPLLIVWISPLIPWQSYDYSNADDWILKNCGPPDRCAKLSVVHAPGMPGTFSPLQRVSDPDMHHETCVTHVPWCMPG